MGKEERFNARIDPDLKAWFKDYAGKRGMSRVLTTLLEDLYRKVTGRAWADRHGENGAAETESSGQRTGPDQQTDRPGLP